jgi:hypothetical protein
VQLWLRSIGISLPIVEIFGGMMHLWTRRVSSR